MRFSLILLLLATFSISGANNSKTVKQAEKLAGNFSRLDEAREKINSALHDSLCPPDARTYFVAGKIEEGAFRHYYKQLAINQADPNIDRTQMADALLAARDYYLKALPLDSIRDKKGNLQTKYSPHIAEFLNSITPSLYNAGVAYMNKRIYYPQGYNAFRAYAETPQYSWYKPAQLAITDSIQASSWFYAGVMAYNAEQYSIAAQSFARAHKLGYPKKEVLLNEMTCLSRIASTDAHLTDSLTHRITALAAEGHRRFGLSTPVFIKKYVAGLLLEERNDSAMSVVENALRTDSVSPLLHSMRAALLRDAGKLHEAADAYLIAASLEGADPLTQRDAAKTIARYGIEIISEIKGTGKSARESRKNIRTKYLQPALHYAEKAKESFPNDPDIENTINTIQYYLH